MKPIEVKLKQDFKKVEKRLDNILVDITYNKVFTYFDSLAKQYVKLIESLHSECMIISNQYLECSETVLSTKDISKEYLDLYENFIERDIVNKLNKVIGNITDLFSQRDSMKHLDNIEMSDTKEIINNFQNIVAQAYYLNQHKLSNQLNHQTFKQIAKITIILNDTVEEVFNKHVSYIDSLIYEVKSILSRCHDRFNKIIKIQEEKLDLEDNFIELKKIFDYKELNKLATELGFEKIRQNGDHAMYSNGINTIPIPQKGLGKGLSCKIQKQLQK